MKNSARKDRASEESAALFKEILGDLGIRFTERYTEAVDGAVSLELTDARHGVAVNGKGVSRADCAASGYGEALERIQSRMSYESGAALSLEATSYLGFSDWVDEEIRPLTRLSECEALSRDFHSCCAEGYDFLTRYIGGDETPFVPYYAVRADKTVMLPDKVVSLICGSNGLAAGNTDEEALCQAISEVLERYAKFEIYKRELTPPAIPDDYIERSSKEAAALIRRIEEKSGFRVFVRDASMGRKLPVANVLLVDQKRQRYYTKFGAHPCFDTALLRCLTELLQGYTPGTAEKDARVMSEWSDFPESWSTGRNLMGAYRSDIATAPEAFLAGKPSWEFSPWEVFSEYTNKAGLKLLLAKLLALTGEVYIRSTGYLGVPAYRVYAPAVSVLPLHFSTRNIRYNELHAIVGDIERRAPSLTEGELREIADAFSADDTSFGGRCDSFNTPVAPKLLHALILYELGEAKSAADALHDSQSVEEKCLRRYITLEMRGADSEWCEALLTTFFGESAAKRVCTALRSRPGALARYLDPLGLMALLRDARADKADRAAKERAISIECLHKRLKEKMKNGMPRQEHTAEILKNL